MVHPAENLSERLACFDEAGNLIEPHTRAEVHEKPLRFWHATSEVWVVNKRGELLCSKRSGELSQNPGKWQTRFGGHVQAGSTFEETAQRELEEEAGIKAPAENLYSVGGVRKSEEWKHLGRVYVYLYEGPLEEVKFNDGEVTETKWLGMEEYNRERAASPALWTNACEPEDQVKIKEWLKHYA